MNTNLLRVLFVEPLRLLACHLVVKLLTLKLRFKVACLSLKVRYLSFKLGKLVLSKRKLLAEYRRRAVLRYQFLDTVNDAHMLVRNDAAQARRAQGVQHGIAA